MDWTERPSAGRTEAKFIHYLFDGNREGGEKVGEEEKGEEEEREKEKVEEGPEGEA